MERHDAMWMLRDLTLLLRDTISAVIRTQEEERGLMLMARIRVTHTPPHSHHFTAITLSLNLKCRVIGMITRISSLFLPISLQEGVGDTGWPQKESKTTLHHDLYRHLYG